MKLERDARACALGASFVLALAAGCGSESTNDHAERGSREAAAGDAASAGDVAARDAAPDTSAQDATFVDSAAADAGGGAPLADGAGADAAQPGDAGSDAQELGDVAGDGAVLCPTDGGVPNDLACTGLYSDWATKTLASGVQAYTPAYLLWSDGAQKSRWVYLPPGTSSTIDTSNMDDWVFPVGTKVWKEFTVGGQIIETRLLWKTSADPYTGWNVLDYRWSSDAHSATLLLDGETNVNGTTYEIPSQTQCFECHEGRKDMLLGFDLVGLGAAGGAGLRLSDLVSQGRLTHAPPATTIAIPEDTTGKAAAALGYLHVNCGVTCHNASSAAQAMNTGLYMKLLATQMYPDGGAGQVNQLDTYTKTVNVTAIDMPNNVNWMRIAPGDAAHSLLPQMAMARDPNAGVFSPMPPIVSHQPDPAGVGTVEAWINAL